MFIGRWASTGCQFIDRKKSFIYYQPVYERLFPMNELANPSKCQHVRLFPLKNKMFDATKRCLITSVPRKKNFWRNFQTQHRTYIMQQ